MDKDSKKPTLLRKGFVKLPIGATTKELDSVSKMPSIEYIIRKFSDKIPTTPHGFIKDKSTTFGQRVFVIKADTGSGKSTVLPAKLYESFFPRTNKNILVTQPRIITAVDNPVSMVEHYPNLILGRNIGYNTSELKLIPSESGILFCTIGILRQELIMKTDEEFMSKYQFIIVDEVHTRDIDIDISLYLLKKLLRKNFKNPECPLVLLMSATFDETGFIEYFEVPKENYIQVEGKTFPIESSFSDYSVSNYVKYATMKSQQIHLNNLSDLEKSNTYKDIIIFVASGGVALKICNALHLFNSDILTKDLSIITEYNSELGTSLESLYKKGGGKKGDKKDNDKKRYHIIPILLDSSSFLQGEIEYQNLFSDMEVMVTPIYKVTNGEIDVTSLPLRYATPTRRIIVATNVAETGITIETLKYCIDTGYQNSAEFYPEYGCVALMPKNISFGSAVQRKGRVGRKSPGQWFGCYTKETYAALPRDELPTIITSNTTKTLLTILIRENNCNIIQELSIKSIKNNKQNSLFQTNKLFNNNWYDIHNELESNIAAIDFIEHPSIQSLSYSIEELHLLGFIDDNYRVTATGFYANKLGKLDLSSIKLIMSGYCYGANILDLITIAAFVSVKKHKIFERGFKLKNFMKLNEIEFTFYNQILIADDFINCLFIWNIFEKFILFFNTTNKKNEVNKNKQITLFKVKKWCKDHDILFMGFSKMIAVRDEIIASMIDIGMNPYYNSLQLTKSQYNLNNILLESLSDGLIEIKKIKQCLYEGFKMQVLVHGRNGYTSLFKNVPVSVKSSMAQPLNDQLVQQTLPKYIVCDSYSLGQKFGKPIFEFSAAGFISVLDNFVTVDMRFCLH